MARGPGRKLRRTVLPTVWAAVSIGTSRPRSVCRSVRVIHAVLPSGVMAMAAGGPERGMVLATPPFWTTYTALVPRIHAALPSGVMAMTVAVVIADGSLMGPAGVPGAPMGATLDTGMVTSL